MPQSKTEDGFNLGNWVSNQRQKKDTLSENYVVKLNKLNFVWDPLKEDWEERYECLRKYFEENGHSRVPQKYKTEDGINLGLWVSKQREKKDILPEEQLAKLNKFNFDW